MTAEAAWDYAIGMIKVDGLEPTEDFKKYIELEKSGKATTEEFLPVLLSAFTEILQNIVA